MQAQGHTSATLSLQRCARTGAAVTALLVFGVGGIAASTQLSSAIIAPGLLVVESNVKRVQHPSGGVVAELRIRDGSVVEAGDILIRLDETTTRANLGVITKTMNELLARQARLRAEQGGEPTISFPAEFAARTQDEDIARLMREEDRLFGFRKSARIGLIKQLRERIEQTNEQTRGLRDQVDAKRREVDLILKELGGVRELWRKNLIQMPRLTALEREEARLQGERGALVSAIAQAKGRIAETELQIVQIDQDMAKEVGRELSDMRGKLAELAERRIVAEDLLKRTEIRAPQAGVAHQLAVHTVGGVIGAGEQIMLIVPKSEALLVEARMAPQDIDQVRNGMQATLRFPAFNQRTTPELEGFVAYVSADVSSDAKSGSNYYSVRIHLAQDQLERLDALRLIPGMPVESFIRTGERSILSYLTKPLTDQITRAWRER